MKTIKTPVKRAGPFIQDADGNIIADLAIWQNLDADSISWPAETAMAHLDDIVLAVNAHDGLVAALQVARQQIEINPVFEGVEAWEGRTDALKSIDNALAAAGVYHA